MTGLSFPFDGVLAVGIGIGWGRGSVYRGVSFLRKNDSLEVRLYCPQVTPDVSLAYGAASG